MASEHPGISSDETVVLLAIDSSDHSERAFNWYIKHFHKENYVIGLAHIFTLPEHRNFVKRHGELEALDCKAYEDEVKEAQQDHQALLKKYKDACEEKGLRYREFCMEKKDSVGEAICELAKEKNVCSIVMGQRGLGVIKRTLFGSVSEYVLHHAQATVVVVPPEKK